MDRILLIVWNSLMEIYVLLYHAIIMLACWLTNFQGPNILRHYRDINESDIILRYLFESNKINKLVAVHQRLDLWFPNNYRLTANFWLVSLQNCLQCGFRMAERHKSPKFHPDLRLARPPWLVLVLLPITA